MTTPWQSRLYHTYGVQTVDRAELDREYGKSVVKSDFIIKNFIPDDKGTKILELGCGAGHLIRRLKEQGYRSVRGIDRSANQVKLAHIQNLPEVSRGTVERELKSGRQLFDVIIMVDVLEHLDKNEVLDILDFSRKKLSEGGKLILHVPNAEGLFGMSIRYGDFTHCNAFTEHSLGQCLKATGFDNARFFSDPPIIHGFISLMRRLIWELYLIGPRLAWAAETGSIHCHFTRNIWAAAEFRNSGKAKPS